MKSHQSQSAQKHLNRETPARYPSEGPYAQIVDTTMKGNTYTYVNYIDNW